MWSGIKDILAYLHHRLQALLQSLGSLSDLERCPLLLVGNDVHEIATIHDVQLPC